MKHSYNWSAVWVEAYKNVPKLKPKWGKPRSLRTLLGYATFKADGRPLSCAEHWRTAYLRGDMPRCPKRRRLLLALAGPYGNVIGKAYAIKMGYKNHV